jgi:hypothetical protein
MKRWSLVPLLAVWLVTSISCRASVDLTKLVVTDVFSGWYDFGIVDGQNKLVPSISFRLKNTSDAPVTRVQLLVSFWREGADGENDSKDVTAIGGDPVAPGASSEPILVRSEVGYKLEQARAELFMNPEFKDFTAKLFARRNGRVVPIGEHKIDRRIIPKVTAGLP